MSGQKWKVEELSVGQTVEATFWGNPVEDSSFKLRATHLDGRRAPKVVLSNDPKIIPGWTSPEVESFSVLRFDPWRLRVFPGTVLMGQGGDVHTWQAS